MECIGCTNCVDACDSIMRQVGRKEGLVRYDSLRGFKGGVHRWLRPRLFLYIALAVLGLVVFGFTAGKRSSFDATVLRARGMPYTLDGEKIQNVFTIHLRNKSLEKGEYELAPVAGAPGLPAVEWRIPTPEAELDALGEVHLSVFTQVARAEYRAAFPIAVRITNETSHEVEVVELQFRGP
jgi:polyferredoxin